MPVPGIHVFLACRTEDVDGRDKPGHDARVRYGDRGRRRSPRRAPRRL